MRKFKHLLVYYTVLFLKNVLNVLSVKQIYNLAYFLGLIMYYIIPIRKKMMYNNIKKVLPELSHEQIIQIIKNSYINIVKSGLEYFIIPDMNKNNYEKFAWIENSEYIDTAVRNKKGVILLGAHFDNPELTANILKISGYPIVSLVKKQQNKYIHKFFEKIRTSNGIELIYKGISVRNIFRILKEKKVLTTVADTSISSVRGVVLDFAGYETPTPVGPAKFGVRTGSVIIPVLSFRMPDNKHRIKVFKPIDYTKLDCNENEKINVIMQEYNNLLYENIKKFPAQWFWMHNRWKHK